MEFYNLTIFGATESSGLGALGVDGQAFIIQLITFVLAYFVLRRFAFGPILKMLQSRHETIESGVRLGEEMRKERAKLEEEIEKILHKTRQEADKIISDAQDSGRQAVREAEKQAHKKAEGILKIAEARITQDTARARKQLQKEAVNWVAETTEAILQEKIDAKKDNSLIEKFLKERV